MQIYAMLCNSFRTQWVNTQLIQKQDDAFLKGGKLPSPTGSNDRKKSGDNNCTSLFICQKCKAPHYYNGKVLPCSCKKDTSVQVKKKMQEAVLAQYTDETKLDLVH
eukprot:5609840-Ditylum_brightwellii.AAC.1